MFQPAGHKLLDPDQKRSRFILSPSNWRRLEAHRGDYCLHCLHLQPWMSLVFTTIRQRLYTSQSNGNIYASSEEGKVSPSAGKGIAPGFKGILLMDYHPKCKIINSQLQCYIICLGNCVRRLNVMKLTEDVLVHQDKAPVNMPVVAIVLCMTVSLKSLNIFHNHQIWHRQISTCS